MFEITAELNCRAILSLLVSSQQSVGEIARQPGMPQPTMSEQLRVLREADFVEVTVDALERQLDHMGQSHQRKGRQEKTTRPKPRT